MEVGLRHDTKEMEANLRHDMKEMETSLRHDMKEMEASLQHDMKEIEANLRHDMKVMEANLRHDMQKELAPIKADALLTKWMPGVLLAGVTSLILKSFFLFIPSPAATDLVVVQFLRTGKPSASSTFALSVLINAVMMVARKHAIR